MPRLADNLPTVGDLPRCTNGSWMARPPPHCHWVKVRSGQSEPSPLMCRHEVLAMAVGKSLSKEPLVVA